MASLSQVAGVFVAANYGKWSTVIQQGNASAGAATVSVANASITLPDGRVITPFATNAPLYVDIGANQDTVTPSAVSGGKYPPASYSPSQMFITATFTFTHGQGTLVRSGTFGLQEAINDAFAQGGGVVVVDNTWKGTTAMITTATGTLPAGVTIQDNRGITNAGSASSISAAIGTAAPSTTRVDRVETTLNYAGSVTIGSGNGSIVSVRGAITVASGTTIAGGFLYGVQGKLTLVGTLDNGSGFNCGLFGQLDTSTATAHTSGYFAPLILDMGATSAIAYTGANGIVFLNTTTKLINSVLQTEAKAAYLFDLNDLSQGQYIVATAKGSGWDKSLKIKLNGTDYYIPCNPAAS